MSADELPWAEDECEELTAPACPAGYGLSSARENAHLLQSQTLSSAVCDRVTRQPLLLVSLDGLRPAYLQKWHALTPVLHKLRQ